MNRRHLIKRNASALSVIALVVAADVALGQSAVYEGFNYAAGARNPTSMTGGVGWAGGFSADRPTVDVMPSSLTSPAALPTTGRSLRWQTSNQSIQLSRTFATPFPTTSDVWVSFITRMDNFPSAWGVHFGSANGPGVSNAISGISLSRGDGSFPLMTGQYEFSESLTLIRLGADSGGTRTISVWVKPTPGALGAPLASVTGPTTPLDRVFIGLAFETWIDEFRVDTNLANVFVPGPGVVGLWPLGALLLRRRRRAA